MTSFSTRLLFCFVPGIRLKNPKNVSSSKTTSQTVVCRDCLSIRKYRSTKPGHRYPEAVTRKPLPGSRCPKAITRKPLPGSCYPEAIFRTHLLKSVNLRYTRSKTFVRSFVPAQINPTFILSLGPTFSVKRLDFQFEFHFNFHCDFHFNMQMWLAL